MRFLIVDDSSTMRRIIVNTLHRLGHTDVVEAGNGREALEAGVDGYVVKPFTPDAMKERIEAVWVDRPVAAPRDVFRTKAGALPDALGARIVTRAPA